METQRPAGEVAREVNSLADLRLDDESLDSLLGHIGRLGVQTLKGWDAAAASLVERNKVATYGATDERINPIDQFQYETARGPCVDALLEGETQYLDGETVGPRWRQFSEVAATAGIYSVISFPLRLDGQIMGALNFYSAERDSLRPGQREEGLLFASQAAVSLANAQALIKSGSEVRQLQEALETRTMIGQATGLLMAHEGLTSDEAFQKLVKVSQNANLKLRDIAQRYVAAWEGKTKGEPTKV